MNMCHECRQWGPHVCMLVCVILIMGLTPASIQAQPTLNFKRVVKNWPTIELYFSVACNGQSAYSMGRQNFEVSENGVKREDFTLWCPDPDARCPISVALVFDCSGSMAGALAQEIQAGLQFVSFMDGARDEACVIRFESSVSLIQTMTVSKTLLSTAISGLTVGGYSACWDGVYEGLLEVIRAGTNPCRAVIVLAEGQDDTSSHDVTECIALATRNRIRAFTIGLGGAPAGELAQLAQGTGGKYYDAPAPGQIHQIFDDISSIILQGFQECLITYNAQCMDGSQRVVDLLLKDFCGGAAMKTKSYTAPRDTATFVDLPIRLGRSTAKSGQEVSIPLILDDFIDGGYLPPATFTIQIDNPVCGLSFRKLTTTGFLLDSVPVTVTPAGASITFTSTQPKLLHSAGVLAQLTFQTGDPPDTCCSSVRFTAWQFAQGCFRPQLHAGEICVFPTTPDVTCAAVWPSALVWDRQARDYSPNPFAVRMIVSNAGDKDAMNSRFRITWDKADLSLAGPMTDEQPGFPKDVPKDNGASEAQWDLRAKPATRARDVDVCITASFDNHRDVDCCVRIHVPPIGAVLDASLSAPTITVDPARPGYSPMPFDLSLAVGNSGGVATDTVWATIDVPAPLVLSGADAPGRRTKMVHRSIAPQGTAGVSWELFHPLSLTRKDYTVTAVVHTSNADTVTRTIVISIPGFDTPGLLARCTVPDSIGVLFPDGTYDPNPFPVSVSCRNMGLVDAATVSAAITLPANVILAAANDSLRKTFGLTTLPPWKPGDAEQSVSWLVRYTAFPHLEDSLDFAFAVGCTGPAGAFVDTVRTRCSVPLPWKAPVTIVGSTGLCPDDSVTLDAGDAYAIYQWTTGATTRSIVVRSPGRFMCTMRDGQGRRIFTRTVDVVARILTPSLQSSRGDIFCDGDSTVLTVDAGYQHYTWNTGETTPTLVVRTSGTYVCSVQDSGGCLGATQPVSITVLPGLKPVLQAHPSATRCRGDSILLDAGQGYAAYQWSTGEQGQTITVWTQGEYSCSVTDSNACTGSASIQVTFQSLPVPQITVVTPPPFCDRDTVVLDAGAGYARYHWSTGEQTRTIAVTTPGQFSVEVETSAGCRGVSPQTPVTFLPGPGIPVIQRTGSALATTAPSSRYTWARNGSILPGDTLAAIIITLNGTYTVTVYSDNGCSATSAPIDVQDLVSVEQPPSGLSLDVYPDPNDGVLNLTVELTVPQSIQISLYDMLGREVTQSAMSIVAQRHTRQIDMRSVPPGKYVLKLQTVTGSMERMITKR